jgi:hypothetical protein
MKLPIVYARSDDGRLKYNAYSCQRLKVDPAIEKVQI